MKGVVSCHAVNWLTNLEATVILNGISRQCRTLPSFCLRFQHVSLNNEVLAESHAINLIKAVGSEKYAGH